MINYFFKHTKSTCPVNTCIPYYATLSDNIGYFERYCNGMYVTRPVHIKFIINWPDMTWFRHDLTPNGHDTTKISLISLDIAQNYPNLAGYFPIFAILSAFAWNMSPFSLTITKNVKKKSRHLTVMVMCGSSGSDSINTRSVKKHIAHPCIIPIRGSSQSASSHSLVTGYFCIMKSTKCR